MSSDPQRGSGPVEGDLDAHPLADRFLQLTPESVLDAVETRGQRCTGRFLILNSYENRVYQLQLEDDSWVVGKFYRPGRWTKDAIEEEHRFLAELRDDEIPVAAPLTLSDGGTVGEIEGIYYTLFPRIGGRTPDEPSPDQYAILGRLIARIHTIGAQDTMRHRPPLTVETFGDENLAFLEAGDHVHPDARANYVATVKILLDQIRPMFDGVPTHRIHGDCHLSNLLWTPDGPMFLDFDDARVGPAVQDIWMMAASADAHGARQRDHLVGAYQEMRPFSESWLRLVEPLRALRFVHYSTWIARRWSDPIFQRTFSHFGTLQYWQREIQDLREQIARLSDR